MNPPPGDAQAQDALVSLERLFQKNVITKEEGEAAARYLTGDENAVFPASRPPPAPPAEPQPDEGAAQPAPAAGTAPAEPAPDRSGNGGGEADRPPSPE